MPAGLEPVWAFGLRGGDALRKALITLFSQSLGATCCGLGRQTYVPLGRKNSRA